MNTLNRKALLAFALITALIVSTMTIYELWRG